MFHYEEKLKDLKVELGENAYSITYKGEKAYFVLKNNFPIRAILTYINANEETDAAEIETENAHHIVVGKGNLKRDVWHFSTPDGPLPTLRCGYTVHTDANTWSSTPHGIELETEEGFEEVFLYLLSSDDRYYRAAIQTGTGQWQSGEYFKKIWRVEDRDISAIPMGYHPVVGEPGVHVSYIWAYLAKHKNWEKI